MTCLLCGQPLTPSRVEAGATDTCAGCDYLLRTDPLMRDVYVTRGGTFAGCLYAKPPRSFRHGTENGYRRHGCTCASCLAAEKAANRRNAEKWGRKLRERRTAA